MPVLFKTSYSAWILCSNFSTEAELASKMYGVDTDEFLKALTRPRVKVGNEWVNKGQNLEQVSASDQ